MKKLLVFVWLIMLFYACNLEKIDNNDGSVVACFTLPTSIPVCDSDCEISFTNCSMNAISYQWTFGDGNTSSQQNPTHTYTSSGNYTVKLVATDAAGSTDSEEKTLIIPTDNTAVCPHFVKSHDPFSSEDDVYKVIALSDGTYVATGLKNSGGNTTPFWYKTDENGEELLQRTFSLNNYPTVEATNMIETADGGFVVCGYGKRNNGGADIYSGIIFKTINTGTIMGSIQTKTLPFFTFYSDVVQLDDESYMACGDGWEFSATPSPALVTKYSITMAETAYQTYPMADNAIGDHCAKIIKANDGNYLIAGKADVEGGSLLGQHIFIAKISASLNLLDTEILYSSNTTYKYDFTDIVPANTGGGYLAVFRKDELPNRDIVIVRLDDNLNVTSENTISKDVSDFPYSITPNHNGTGYAITGARVTNNSSDKRPFLLLIDNNGNETGYKTYASKEAVAFSVARVDDSNCPGYLLGGYMANSLSRDILLIRTDTDGNE